MGDFQYITYTNSECREFRPSQDRKKPPQDSSLSVRIINPLILQKEASSAPDINHAGAPPKWFPWSEIWPHPDWALNALTFVLVLVGILQLIVFSIQVLRLRQTIAIMKLIDVGQSQKMTDSIAQASRAADSMGQVAESTRIAADANFKVAMAAEESARAAWESSSAADRTARIMLDTAKRQLRASVSVAPGDLKVLKVDEEIVIEVIATNHGQTPAHKTWYSGHVGIYRNPLPLDSGISEPEKKHRHDGPFPR